MAGVAVGGDDAAALDPVARVWDEVVRVILAELVTARLNSIAQQICQSMSGTCGGKGKMSVVELFLLATAQPRLCALKLRSCCIKSELSISAMSAK